MTIKMLSLHFALFIIFIMKITLRSASKSPAKDQTRTIIQSLLSVIPQVLLNSSVCLLFLAEVRPYFSGFGQGDEYDFVIFVSATVLPAGKEKRTVEFCNPDDLESSTITVRQ